MPSASSIVKTLIRTYAEIKPDEARLRLHDLFEAATELEDENRRLREEVGELTKALQRRKDMEFRDGGYYIIADEAEFGPICPRCYEAEGFAYSLKPTVDGDGLCTVCGRAYPGTTPGLPPGPFGV